MVGTYDPDACINYLDVHHREYYDLTFTDMQLRRGCPECNGERPCKLPVKDLLVLVENMEDDGK